MLCFCHQPFGNVQGLCTGERVPGIVSNFHQQLLQPIPSSRELCDAHTRSGLPMTSRHIASASATHCLGLGTELTSDAENKQDDVCLFRTEHWL